MSVEHTQIHDRRDPRIVEAKAQIARAVDLEMKLMAEERRERAERLGLSEKLGATTLR
jgi:hypothetical protein